MGPKGGCNLDFAQHENHHNNHAKITARAWVKVIKMHDITQYLSYVMMPGRRRCPQVRGPDNGGFTVIA